MKLAFLPGDLRLGQLEDGSYRITISGQEVFYSRSRKSAVEKFNELRADMERQFPPTGPTQEEKHAILQRAIADALVAHNSLGGRKKRSSAGSTRTFGG